MTEHFDRLRAADPASSVAPGPDGRAERDLRAVLLEQPGTPRPVTRNPQRASRSGTRPRAGTGRVIVAFGIALAVVVPAFLWTLQHEHPTTAVSNESEGAGRVARVLLTGPAGAIDALTGRLIPPGTLGVAENGCVTLGGAYLQAAYGSALSDGGRGAALSDIGVYRFGDTVPAIYGYSRTFTAEDLPADHAACGPGAYVDALRSSPGSTGRASTLLTGAIDGGEATTLNGILNAAGNGCARVGNAYLVALSGSILEAGGASISLPGAGRFTTGTVMPALPARSRSYTAADLPVAFQGCGPGVYTSVTGQQDGPVLVSDPVNDSARMVVLAASAEPAPSTLTSGGVLALRNTCVTVGERFLSAPHGSTVFDGGRRIRLPGIGTFALGDDLPALPGRSVRFAEGSVPVGVLNCGPGTYDEVWPR